MSMAGHNPEQYDIFLSYAREDAARIRPLVSALEAEGWTTFWDKKIPPAETWRSYIGLRLRSASVVIVVWSEYSIQSDWVITEAEDAHKRRALIPTLIDAVEAPLGLNQIQAADLVEWMAGTGGTLPEDLRAAIERKIPAQVGARAATSRDSIESTSESKVRVGEEFPEVAPTLPSKPAQQITTAENDEAAGIDRGLRVCASERVQPIAERQPLANDAPEPPPIQRKPRTAGYGVVALIIAVGAAINFATYTKKQQEQQQAELVATQRAAIPAADEANRKAEAERPRIAEEAFAQGDKYYFGEGVPQDYAQALSWYRKAAEQGNAPAQCNLGIMYQKGQGVPQDYAQAVSWYRKAAEQGNAPAQNGLGIMYEAGHGVPQDYAQAVSWYRKAAEQGDAAAQFNLGVMYEAGLGVSQNYVQAYKWYSLAVSRFAESEIKNRNETVEKRNKLAAKMTPAQIAEAQSLIRQWKPSQ
jgi:TIR domain/Sel1 repeat